ncbi:MAG: GDP-mannose dehydrogenase [Acidiferrobacteraceae bacterium]|jgi:UDP-N-acetyl-D-galactosamine dehydrogenase|nr:GDP-mannose dehydrogenase [Acidiferrobacteraceae bacterium]MDP6919861.1 nucleotide sugar dehydrogenase [Arenicellales bacterium]|tara:strand:- start:4633 stop:5913 length:1281 start_codon:yes stop_codon:yes gene_type:complete
MKIAIIGLGYVGIQLAAGLGRKHSVIGLDLDAKKIADYQSGYDSTGEVSEAELRAADSLEFTTRPSDLKGCEIFIVAVPTPVDSACNPDFGPLLSASRTVGSVMGSGSTVVYESTVYPGATEEVCVPQLESASGLTWKKDFSVGYSPERINPGDPEHTLATITKVVSADNDETLDMLAQLYGEVVPAGIHRAPSIRVAEAAKVIENTQRDLNIALVNELVVLFDRLNINTRDVLDAAGSKWNFLPFKPGLVGGHCIGVDPYYLTHKAQMVSYQPEVILAGRRINDSMAHFVAGKTLKLMTEEGISASGATANVLGVTFKENCPDTRNSQVFPLIEALEGFGLKVSAVDPRADVSLVYDETGVHLKNINDLEPAAVTLLAVPHRELCEKGYAWLQSMTKTPGVLVDIQAVFRASAAADDETLRYWSL